MITLQEFYYMSDWIIAKSKIQADLFISQYQKGLITWSELGRQLVKLDESAVEKINALNKDITTESCITKKEDSHE